MKTIHETRKQVCETLQGVVEDLEITQNLEKEILEFTKDECKEKRYPLKWDNIKLRRVYLRKYRSVLFNLQDKENTLLERVQSGHVTPRDVVRMHYTEMNHERWKDILEKFKNREHNTLLADTEQAYDGLLQCETCKGYNTRYVTMQLRSADEPMTTFVSCWTCMINWTI